MEQGEKKGVNKQNKTVTLFLFLILFYFSFFVFSFLKKKTDCTELNLYAYSEFSQLYSSVVAKKRESEGYKKKV